MKAGLFDALEDSVELGVAHVEGIVVTVKRGVLVATNGSRCSKGSPCRRILKRMMNGRVRIA